MNYAINLFLILLFSLFLRTVAQSNKWKIYQTFNSEIPSNSISVITQDYFGDYWIGFSSDNLGNKGGLFKFNGIDWQRYDTDSLDLESTLITDIANDELNNIYVTTFGKGIFKFDGNSWQIFNVNNSELPTNDILCVSVENKNKIWFGTYWSGILKYEFNNWTNYTQQNSGLTFDEIALIEIDSFAIKWIGTDGVGVVTFDDSTWTKINCTNFLGLVPVFGLAISNNNEVWITTGGNSNRIGFVKNGECISFNESDIGFDFSPAYPVGLGIGLNNTKWIGTSNGLVSYDEVNWIKYNPTNSPIPGKWVSNIFVDNNNNIWFTFGDTIPNSNGLAVYNPNGIVGITDIEDTKEEIPNTYSLQQNYPNPFNPSTIIKYSVPSNIKLPPLAKGRVGVGSQVTLKVYDILGREVTVLVNKQQNPGNYSVTFTAGSLPSGVYYYQLKAGDPLSGSGQGFTKTKKMLLLR